MDQILGSIALYPFQFEMQYWSECAGQLLPIQNNPALFSLLGTQFGGDGVTTFALPDLRKNAPAPGLRYCIATQGVYPQRT